MKKPDPEKYPYAEFEWVNPALPEERIIFIKKWIRGVGNDCTVIWVKKSEEMKRIKEYQNA